MIDTHCHIDEEAFAPDREEVIARQRAEGVAAMIVPGVNVASIESVLDVCHAHPGYCFPALGLHPEDVKENWAEQLDIIERAIRTHREEIVAIGEIGLDYYWDVTYKEAQQEVLRRQLELARELELPVILHNRESTEDIVRILEDAKNKESGAEVTRTLRGVFHCFNGSKETAERILKMGFYLGVGGVLTFKNCKLAETLKELQGKCPMLIERLLLETDAPYMAPVPHRGERNESRLMTHVADKLAEALGVSKEEVIGATTKNAKQLFNLITI
ncbi:MAG: TatD family hydrolase [Paludibacteraceae bacterium]|nr:TatD family hydrolase [Paludibacteraceae bacterium]